MTKHGNVIGVDIDLTVCPTDEYWFDWLLHMTQSSAQFEHEGNEYKADSLFMLHKLHDELGIPVNYNLTSYFPKPINSNVNPFDFFRREGIYDTFIPYKGVIKVLRALYDKGYEIVFVSHNKGNHSKSKYNFLERYFGNIGGIEFHSVTTHSKEKFRANVDFIIDDRLLPLNVCYKNGIKCVMRETNYSQGSDEKLYDFPTFSSWEHNFPHNLFPKINK